MGIDGEKMKIGLFYDAKNICYGTLNFFTSKIEETLAKYGIQTEIIKEITGLDISVTGHYDAFVGLNHTLPSIQMPDNSYVMDFFGCPFFNIIVDPPYYHNIALNSHMNNLYCIFLDEGHVDYCSQYYPPCKSVEMGYLLGPIGNEVPYRERKIDVLFTGGLYNFESIKDRYIEELENNELRKLFLYLIECGIRYPEKTMSECVKRWFGHYGCEINNDDFNLIMGSIGQNAEYYLRGYYREKIVKALIREGITVHVAGGGWEKFAAEEDYKDNLVLMGTLDMQQTGDITSNSKILINVMPWFKDGIHDRVLTAMHNGTVCVTDSSSYIDSHFVNMENIVLYNLKEIDRIPDKIKWLLNHPEQAEKIAKAGKNKALLEYTWDKLVLDHVLKWLW